jgi:acyl-CoA synthetase (AMP-forming)/AMP-acid ligase II
VSAGQVGELYVRSRTVMDGCWNDTECTAEVLDEDGWFRSGDLARQDEDGYLYLVGRVRDIIVTGSTADNVYSRLLDDFSFNSPISGTPPPSACPVRTRRRSCTWSWYRRTPPPPQTSRG